MRVLTGESAHSESALGVYTDNDSDAEHGH